MLYYTWFGTLSIIPYTNSRNRGILEKLIVPQKVKKLLAFNETSRFTAVFTRVQHVSSWARLIYSKPSHTTFFMFILTLSSKLHVPRYSVSFYQIFHHTTLYAFLLSSFCATCPVYLILLDLITLIKFILWVKNHPTPHYANFSSFILLLSS